MLDFIKRQKEKRASSPNYIALYLLIKIIICPFAIIGLILLSNLIISYSFLALITCIDAYISYMFTENKVNFLGIFLAHMVLNIIFIFIYSELYLSSPIV